MAPSATYTHDLAISAVAYDTLLVHDVLACLSPRLRRPPVWIGASLSMDVPASSLVHEDASRVVLVLAQRLWGRDDTTSADAEILRARARRLPGSIIVASLDGDPLPRWMLPLRRRVLASTGVDGIAQFALDAVAKAGGTVDYGSTAYEADVAVPFVRWADRPTPYLDQARAHGALRRELDAVCADLQPWLDAVEQRGGDHIVELHRTPNRVVARVDDVGVTFSWVPGRVGTVGDGRLMVIEWSGIGATRGLSALGAGRPVRECVYGAETNGSDTWRWRADVPNGRASSTVNLVGEWMDGATLAAHPLVAEGAP